MSASVVEFISSSSPSISFAFDFACSSISRCFIQLDIPSSRCLRCSSNWSFAFCHSSFSVRSLSMNSFCSTFFNFPLTCSPRVFKDFCLFSTSFCNSLEHNKKQKYVRKNPYQCTFYKNRRGSVFDGLLFLSVFSGHTVTWHDEYCVT